MLCIFFSLSFVSCTICEWNVRLLPVVFYHSSAGKSEMKQFFFIHNLKIFCVYSALFHQNYFLFGLIIPVWTCLNTDSMVHGFYMWVSCMQQAHVKLISLLLLLLLPPSSSYWVLSSFSFIWEYLFQEPSWEYQIHELSISIVLWDEIFNHS